jgi:hypothetical protein
MVTSPLISFPAELRLRVYNFVLPQIPLSAPPSQYTGLLYSCRLVRQELEPEILKRMTAFLFDIQGRCRHIHPEDMLDDGVPEDLAFNVPQDLDSLYNLRVERPSYEKLFTREDPFMALLYMYFNTLTIVSQPNTTVARTLKEQFRTQSNMLNLGRWIASRDASAIEPAAKKIVYDWSMDPQNSGGTILGRTREALEKRKGWEVVYRRHSDHLKMEGVEFLRFGMSIGKEEGGSEIIVEQSGWCTMKDGALEYFHPFT